MKSSSYELSRREDNQELLQAKLQLVQGILESKGLWGTSTASYFKNAGRFPSYADEPEIYAVGKVSARLSVDEKQFGFPYLQVVEWQDKVTHTIGGVENFTHYDFRGVREAGPDSPSFHPNDASEEILSVRNIDAMWIGSKAVGPEVAFEQLDNLIRHAIVPAS